MAKQAPRVNNTFLIGAGFTKAVFPNAPLNKDLLTVLCKGTSCTTLKRYYKEYKTNDIEILLTRLDLDILRPKRKQQIALQQVRKSIEQQLAEYFRQFRFKEEILTNSMWLKEFVNLFQPNDAIISLNYDCLTEGLLDHYQVWCPSTGYGAVEVDVAGTSISELPNPKNIKIYKIHGSENFHTCSVDLKDVDQKKISLVVNEKIYPTSGKNCNLGVVEGKPYIIAPSFVKIPYPQIEFMMIDVLQAAAQAKNFVVIGCSLRPEDSFLWLLLTSFLNQPPNNRKLVIVDPCAKKLADKITNHYFVDIKEFVRVKTLPKTLQDAMEELIIELHECHI